MKGIICNQCKEIIVDTIFNVKIIPLKIPRKQLFSISQPLDKNITISKDYIDKDRLDFCSEKCLMNYIKKEVKNENR